MSTIMITGSTDGIGFETAKHLARLGHRRILHGRNPTKLDDARTAVEAQQAGAVVGAVRGAGATPGKFMIRQVARFRSERIASMSKKVSVARIRFAGRLHTRPLAASFRQRKAESWSERIPVATEMRPMQRRVRRLAEAGMDEDEIAWRFRRSPRLIRQVLECSYQDRPRQRTTRSDVLRPLERTILNWRAAGASYVEIAARFRRSPDFIRRVEALALRRSAENGE